MNKIICDRERMTGLMTTLRSAAVISNRLPAFVFRPGYRRFRFLEFDITLSDDIWAVLQNLAHSSRDPHVNLAVLEPDPVEYFFDRFHRYGALRLEISSTKNDYYEALAAAPAESAADAFLYNSEVIAWFPDSGAWLIWGERSCGLAVLGLHDDCSAAPDVILKNARIPALPLDQALLDFVPLNFRDMSALDSFLRHLEQNYGAGPE
jgi:hypothetical protein